MNRKIQGLVIRWSLICLAAVCLGATLCTRVEARIEHDLTVTLSPDEHRLSAIDRIILTGPDLQNIAFMLAKHVNVSAVTIGGGRPGYRFSNGLLQVDPPNRREPLVLAITYEGVFNDQAPVQPLNTDNPGFGVTGAITPQGTLLLDGARWYPASHMGSDSYRLTVSAPAGTLSLTTGHLIEHVTTQGRSISRWSLAHPEFGMPLVAGPYIRTTRAFGPVTAATYFSSSLQSLSADYLAATGRYLQRYADLFGPYPFNQFAVVENFFPTGYGFPGFTLMGGQVLRLPFIIHTSLGHEIAHCWWGNGVLVDPAQGNWSEGLTTYVADYLYKEKQGLGRQTRLEWLQGYAGLIRPGNDFPLSRFSSRNDPVTKTIGYDKGAMIFHMLRRTVGEETFWSALRRIYDRFCFQAVTWSDLLKVFEEQSGRKLDWFLDQWVFRTGAPDFRLADVKITQGAGGYRVSGNIRQGAPFYRFSVDMVLGTTGQAQRRTVSVAGPDTAFEITSLEKPAALEVDPQIHVFRKLEAEEIPATINALKATQAISILVARQLGEPYLEIARRLAVSLGLDNARIGFIDTFKADALNQSNILCIGRPGVRDFPHQAGLSFSLEPGSYTLMGKAYNLKTTSFFGVFKAPGNPARIQALFLPASHESAFAVSAKITHYGKYSYLVFDGARNRVKGVWPVTSSALTRQFTVTGEDK